MSEDVLNSDGPGDSQLSTGVRFGEIIVTPRREIVLRCSFCSVEYRVYKNFLDHILAHYYAEKQQSKASRAQQQQIGADETFDTQMATELVLIEQSGSPTGDYNIEQATEAEAQNDQFCEQESISSDEASGSLPLPPIPKKKWRKTNEQVYKCETCGATCKGWSNWRVHIRRHDGEKPHKCSYCEKRFCTTTECKCHERRHTGERPFVCVFCGQSYFSSGQLNRHEREHQGDRPYQCDLCEKSFFHADRLRDHLLVHTGERNHICNICNAAFARSRNLKVHMKLHVNAREYQCNLCDLAFNQLASLWMHKKNNHKIISISKKTKYADDCSATVEPQ